MPVENVKIGTTSSAERRGQDKRISWGDNECYKTPSPVYKAAFEVKALADINSYLQSESCVESFAQPALIPNNNRGPLWLSTTPN